MRDEDTFTQGIPDFSNDLVKTGKGSHILEMGEEGEDPEVLVGNTQMPIEAQQSLDKYFQIELEKFRTKNISITDEELFYIPGAPNKLPRKMQQAASALREQMTYWCAHQLAPDTISDTLTNGAIQLTTGATDNESTAHKKITVSDIIQLNRKMSDRYKISDTSQIRIVLCNKHLAELLETEESFATQYHNLRTGQILPIYGAELVPFGRVPKYKSGGNKYNYGETVGDLAGSDLEASFAFYVPRTYKAMSQPYMYNSGPSANNPFYERQVFHPRIDKTAGVITKDDQPFIGAIVEDTV
jgi:hypothetical protein